MLLHFDTAKPEGEFVAPEIPLRIESIHSHLLNEGLLKQMTKLEVKEHPLTHIEKIHNLEMIQKIQAT